MSKYAEDDLRERIHALIPLSRMIRNQNFDIIHAAFGANSATAAMLLSKLTNIPFTFESHALDLFVSFRFAEEKLQRAHKVFTISHYNKRYLINKYKCPESKIIIKRVPFSKEYCDTLTEIQKDQNLIVSVCRLHPIKGLKYAIEAFDIVQKNNNKLRYFIIGDGELKQTLEEKVHKLGLIKKITFTGDVPNHEALTYIKKASIFLLPSVISLDGDRDGIPTSLIESMYLQTPVISSSISGIPELIKDGHNGFLTQPKNVNEIALKLQTLLSNAPLRIQMGKKAKDTIMDEFDLDRNIQKLIDVWTLLVSS
jgi:glycosyltransferase involved in cell wall biosynthesis